MGKNVSEMYKNEKRVYSIYILGGKKKKTFSEFTAEMIKIKKNQQEINTKRYLCEDIQRKKNLVHLYIYLISFFFFKCIYIYIERK